MLYSLAQFFLFRLDAETAHNLTIRVMQSRFFPRLDVPESPVLRLRLWHKSFPNPIGLAAGFDKNAQVITPALGLGFGFTEVGTVTPRPQDGNPKPRVFRSPKHHAVINRMGFPNAGLHVFQENLTRFLEQKPRPSGLVGLNIGLNKASIGDARKSVRDYTILIRALAPMADYLSVNISSPNTPGLRDFQKPDAFKALVTKLQAELKKTCGDHPPPLLVKLAPDLQDRECEELASVALELNLDGLILTNTTLSRPDHLPRRFAGKQGGLSGKPLFKPSTETLKTFYRLTAGKIPLIGVGGVESADDAYAKIRAGASLVQLYTGMVYQGPEIARNIVTGLESKLKHDGFNHISEAIGIDAGISG